MLFKIPILTCLIFASTYPLCFWISADDPLKQDFHKFHVGLPNFISGVAVVALILSTIPMPLKILIVLWKTIFLGISHYSWRKETPSPVLMTVPCVIGIYVFAQVQSEWIGINTLLLFMSVLGGLILSSAIYSMNLGHWYLNVHGLAMKHLKRAVFMFWGLVGIRAVVDTVLFLTRTIIYDGDILPLYMFISRMDGFLLLIAIFFGTLFPLVALYFVKGTLDVKSTQSATGILYVILSAVLIGDLTYKYYLIKFGIIL